MSEHALCLNIDALLYLNLLSSLILIVNMWHLATAHAQSLRSGWAYSRVKIPSCKNFEAKEGMGPEEERQGQ